jgi:hypothetical protein
MPVTFSPTMRATNYSTNAIYVPVTRNLNNCNNTLCYTYNHNYISPPHSGGSYTGRTSAGYLFVRKRA